MNFISQWNPNYRKFKQLELFELLKEQLKAEEETIKCVRRAENLVDRLVQLRISEHNAPSLTVGLFDRKRNQDLLNEYLQKVKKIN